MDFNKKEIGIIRVTPSEVLEKLGFKGLTAESIVCDIFSNQVIIAVTGDIERYPEVKPKPPFKAVTGL